MYQKRNNKLEVLRLFTGDYKKRFYLREISKLANLPVKTTQNTLLNLEEENILKSEIEGKNKYFKLNLENIQTKYMLLQTEIYKTQIFLEKYPLFKSFLKKVKSNGLMIVFGSFAKFKAHKDSDVDLFIIPDKEKLHFHLLPYKIHKIELKEESFERALKEKENLIEEIKENHIILNNHSLYVNLIWRDYGN